MANPLTLLMPVVPGDPSVNRRKPSRSPNSKFTRR